VGVSGNILTGPVSLYRGAAEAAEGAITTEIGYTEDGLAISYNETVVNLEVDEELYPVGQLRTGVEMTVSFQCAEATLQNICWAFGLPASAYDSGTKTLTIDPDTVVNYISLKATGKAPEGAATRTYVFPKVCVRGQRQMAIRKGQKVLIPVELVVFKPSSGAPATFKDA
jgi:hypothetical protein